MLNPECGVVTWVEEKAEVLNIRISCPEDTQLPEMEVVDGQMSEAHKVQNKMVSDVLCQINTHRSVGPDGIHLRGMRELASVFAKTLSIIYQQSCLTGEVLQHPSIRMVGGMIWGTTGLSA